MQLNEFDNFILKLPNAATNVFTAEDIEKNKTWSLLLPLLSVLAMPVGLILTLVLYLKQKDTADDYFKYLVDQSLWVCIGSLLPLVGLCFGAIAVYGNYTGKFFSLPLIGNIKLIKY